MNTTYNLKFSKFDRMRFIGHLDLMKFFQRAIKKAKLPVAFSQGFNPHQLMSFALPLSLGFGSNCECIEVTMENELSESLIMESLNKTFPSGLLITDVRKLPASSKTSASLLSAASYKIELDETNNLGEAIEKILSSKEIIVSKKTKKGFKDTDIRCDIFKIELNKDNPKVIDCLLSAGSTNNLKPELVVNLLYNYMNIPLDKFNIKYTRTNLFKTENDNFVDLF